MLNRKIRSWMRAHRAQLRGSIGATQAEVMRKLGLKDRNEFYRLYYRADKLERSKDRYI